MCVASVKLSVTAYKLSVTLCKQLQPFKVLLICVEPLSLTHDSYITLDMHLMPCACCLLTKAAFYHYDYDYFYLCYDEHLWYYHCHCC